MLSGVLDQIGEARFWLDAAILTAVIRVVWTVMQKVTERFLFALALRTRTIELKLTAEPDVPKEIMSLKYLFIRYSNDTYLRELASDQERHHGRLRNKVHSVKVLDLPDGGKLVSLKLKVHRRLGTQFKMFVDVDGDAAPVVAYLESHKGIFAVDRNNRPGGKQRIFFLLNEYPVVETVDGFKNNMIFPI